MKIFLISILFFSYFISYSQKDSIRLPERQPISFLAIGTNIGYQFQKSSALELGVNIFQTYWSKKRFGYLVGAGFNIECDFANQTYGKKISLEVGSNITGLTVLFTGNFLFIDEVLNRTNDIVFRPEIGLAIPFGLAFGRKFVGRIIAKYGYNLFLDSQDITTIDHHTFNVSLILGFGFSTRKKTSK